MTVETRDRGPIRAGVCCVCRQPAKLYPSGWRCSDHLPTGFGPVTSKTN